MYERLTPNQLFALEPKIPGTNSPVTVTIEYSHLGSRLTAAKFNEEPIRKHTVYASDLDSEVASLQEMHGNAGLRIEHMYTILPGQLAGDFFVSDRSNQHQDSQSPTERVTQYSRETHFALRELLLRLRSETLEQGQKQLVDNRVAYTMRTLCDYHRLLYEQEQGKPLLIEHPYQLQAFFQWRRDRLGVFGNDGKFDNDSHVLFRLDRERFNQLFQRLYSPDSYTNHWHIKILGGIREMDLGIHTDLTYGIMLSHFVPGRETQFLCGENPSEYAMPQIIIEKNGRVDMSKLTQR